MDALKLELVNEVNQMRRRAYLLPKESMVHQIPIARFGEYQSEAYRPEAGMTHEQIEQEYLKETDFYNCQTKKILDFWKLPSFYECCTVPYDLEEFQELNSKRRLYSFTFEDSVEWLEALKSDA